MGNLKWWMRVVGSFYILLFIMAALLRLPPKVMLTGQGIDYQVENFAHKLLVDTWVMFGLELGVIGVALWLAARNPWQNRVLVWTVIGLEVVRGIIDDIYMLARGYDIVFYVGWIVVHSIIIVWAYFALKQARDAAIPAR